MTKIFKDEKIFNNFKKQFNSIFKDKSFIEMTKNHFNKNGSFAVFTLAFLQNRVDEKTIIESVRINSEDWVDLFANLYKDNNVIESFNKLNLNPLITLENIKSTFVVFEKFIETLWDFINEQNWKINISKNDYVQLLKSVYGYFMYNAIECKLYNSIPKIVQDPQYETKYTIILNNTKLFAEAKSHILNHCESKISDLIVIILGGSNHLALDK